MTERTRDGVATSEMTDWAGPVVRLRRHSLIASGTRLSALVYEPSSEARGAIVLAHGYTGSKETLDVPAAYLCSRGWQCLTFDFRGHKLGGSDGAMLAASDAVDDVSAAIAEAKRLFGVGPTALVGHSMGGAAALVAASQNDDVAAVAALGTSGTVVRGFGTKAGESLMAQRGDYVVGAPAPRILRQLGELCARDLALESRPALLIAARGDVIVRPDHVQDLARRCGASAEFVIVEGGHMDLPVRSRGVVSAWLDRISAEWPVSRTRTPRPAP